ncbi:MAG TPA: DUF2950 family protein [Planctomycetota bacterium]|nr:DUF2950 family protein [Planctomycetota bacterium]
MERNRRGSWTPIVSALLLLGLLAAAVGIPEGLKRYRLEKERSASQALWMLTKAEGEFRMNDRDGNGVQDFWTTDVASLYALGLIPRELAEADAAPLHPLVPQPIPYHGYYFRALQQDDSETPPAAYRQVTDKKSGAVHNLERFGFIAYPAEGFTAGKFFRIVNENNTVFHSLTGNPVPTAWPSDNQIRVSWSKIEGVPW